MKNSDRLSGIILFLFGLAVFLKSLSYPLGSIHSPGAGVFPVLASILLMVIAAALVINSYLKREEKGALKAPFFPSEETPKRILYGIISLVVFRYLLPVIGFAPSTFLLIFFMGKFLAHYNWKVNIFFSFLTALVSYYLFQIWLSIPMPIGIFGI
jgi:putative tricarboxylic transport membrane protein